MEKLRSQMVLVVTMINLILTHYFGERTILVYMVVALMGLDVITHLYAHSIGRKDGRKEVIRDLMRILYIKIGMILFILLSLILEIGLKIIIQLVGIKIMDKMILTNLTLAWLFVREMMSNLENLKKAGVEMPSFILQILSRVKVKVDDLTLLEVNKSRNK